jgi:hypothetical protein
MIDEYLRTRAGGVAIVSRRGGRDCVREKIVQTVVMTKAIDRWPFHGIPAG